MGALSSASFPENALAARANPVLGGALERLQHDTRAMRPALLARVPEFDALRDAARDIRDGALDRLDTLLETFEANVIAAGGQVYWCNDAAEARATIVRICRGAGARTIAKGKSMVSEEIELNAADRDFNQSFYDETEKKRVRGMAPRSDALNFKIRLEKARIRSLDSSRDYRLAILVLAELLGMPTAGIVQTPDLKPESVGMSLELAGLGTLLDTAWVTRTDLQEMKAGLNRAKAELGAAAGARFPQLFLTGDIGTFSRDDFRVERDNRTSSFGIIANWDVFTGGAKAAMVKAARADYAATLEDLNRLWDAIVGEIRQQLEIVRTAWEKLRIQREITAMTHGIRSDIEKEYKAGQASLTRLNEVQRDLRIARVRLARNRAEYLQSSEDLAAATGEILAPYLQPAPDKLTR